MEEHVDVVRGRVRELWWFERDQGNWVDSLRATGYLLRVRWPHRRRVRLLFSTERFIFSLSLEKFHRLDASSVFASCLLDRETCVASNKEGIEVFELPDAAMMDAMVARYCEFAVWSHSGPAWIEAT